MTWETDWRRWTQATYGLIQSVHITDAVSLGNFERLETALKSASGWSTLSLGFTSAARRQRFRRNSIHITHRLLSEYMTYYHEDRCHLGLDKDTPNGREVTPKPSPDSRVAAIPRHRRPPPPIRVASSSLSTTPNLIENKGVSVLLFIQPGMHGLHALGCERFQYDPNVPLPTIDTDYD